MRIGLITHIYPRFPGDYKGTFVADLARFLVERGHYLVVATPLWPGTARAEVVDGVRVHRFWYWGWRRGKRLGELKASSSPFVLGSLLASGVWTALGLARRYHLDLLHGYWVVPGGTMALLAGALAGRPVVATAAGSDLNQAAYQPIAGRVVRFTLRRMHTLMAPGSQLARRAVESGIPQERVQLLMGHSGIDLSRFTGEQVGGCASGGSCKALDRTLQRSEDFPIVLYVGNLSPPKRVDVVLRAMSRVVKSLPDARLLLVGDGELRMELESLVSELGIGQAVEFLGARPHDEIPGWMRQADVLVHCSEHEGLPMVIMEAFGCGLPVVAAGVGGIPDLVREGETGYLLDTGDDVGFARKLIKLLSQPELAARLGANARAFAETHLAKERVLERVEAVYAAAVPTLET